MTPRAFLRLLGMALWLGVCVLGHVAVRGFGPSPWPRRLLRGIGWLAGARVTTRGNPPGAQTLIVANHVSWLDIPVLAGASGCGFVAKDGLKDNRIMRWLCRQNGTVFVDRENRGTIGTQLDEMNAALASNRPLTLFPEGTVGLDGQMLPFRSSLLKLAENPPVPLTVQPAAIDYGDRAAAYGWPAGEAGIANFLRLLGHPGPLALTIHFLPPLAPGRNRKQMAAEARAAIVDALATGGEAAPRL